MFGIKKKQAVFSPYDDEVLLSYLNSLDWKQFADSDNKTYVKLSEVDYLPSIILMSVKFLESDDYIFRMKGTSVIRIEKNPKARKKDRSNFIVATVSGPDIATYGVTAKAMLEQANLSKPTIAKILEEPEVK